jgi:hypothetical protein
MDVLQMMRPLVALTAVSLGLAIFAGLTDRKVNDVKPPEILLADYATSFGDATRLDMTFAAGISGTRGIRIELQNGKWVLPERGNYPANQELVTETLLALADLKAVEARTQKPKWHRALGLVVPEDLGRAMRFKVRTQDGTVLTSLLLGNEQESEAEAKQDVKTYGPELRQFYARQEGDNQTWLARGRLPRNPNVAAWLDSALPRYELEQLKAVSFGKGAQKFKLLRVTPVSLSMGGGDTWVSDFKGLKPDDVSLADSINFETAQPMVLRYANGLVITYENVGAATVIWTRISASVEAVRGQNKTARDEVRSLAADINARYKGWALRFSAHRAPILLPSQAMLEGR